MQSFCSGPRFSLGAGELSSLSVELGPSVASHEAAGQRQGKLFQFTAKTSTPASSHHDSFLHRCQQFKYFQRHQDNTYAGLHWRCSRAVNWSHANKISSWCLLQAKIITKEILNKWYLRDPEVLFGRGWFTLFFHFFCLSMKNLQSRYALFNSGSLLVRSYWHCLGLISICSKIQTKETKRFL